MKIHWSALLFVLFGEGCASDPTCDSEVLIPGKFAGDPVIMIGAGDIADTNKQSEKTAKLLEKFPDAKVFTLGDNAYDAGSSDQFKQLYKPTWGLYKDRTRPVVGNHEYQTHKAEGYYKYFGTAAGDPKEGYYSYNVGDYWHVVVVNSADLDGKTEPSEDLGPGSEQYKWLERDLENHRGKNVIAMWHHPRFSSGYHEDNPEMQDFWRLLNTNNVDIALAGHDHNYERFAPVNAEGNGDALGVRSFVVGTGGTNPRPFVKPAKPTTKCRNADTFGVLKLTLYQQGYEWEFIPVEGSKFKDSGYSMVH